MAGTIVVDRIESDASYASNINVASQITFSNTVNFGITSVAPVAGFYSPSTNNLAFTTASTERMRIDSLGNVGIGTNSPTGDGTALHINASTYAHLHFTNSTTGTTVNDGFDIITVGSDILFRNRETAAIQFATTGTERMRIDSSGRLLVGTSTSPSSADIKNVISSTTGAFTQYSFNGGAGAVVGALGTSTLGFYTYTGNIGAETYTERMRIDSSGLLLIGLTSGNADAKVSINAGSTDSSPCIDFRKGSATTTTSQVFARFWASGGSVATGSITSNGVSVATFTGYSDRRLKENIVNLPSQLANIMALRPVEFDFKGYENGEGHQIGFIAQEVQEIYPDLVGEGDDGMLTLSDMNKNDARLIKAIQELKAIVDTQASTITALTTRITALESK